VITHCDVANRPTRVPPGYARADGAWTGAARLGRAWQDGGVPNPDLRAHPAAPPAGPTRRGLLAGAVGLAGLGGLTGCDPFADEVPAEIGPHALDGLVAGTVALAGRYQAAIAAVPALADSLTPVQETHQRHATVLAQAIGRPMPTATAPAEPAPAGRAAAVAALATAEKAARDEAVTACLAATARLATLLGTMAAARASHLEILK
jgi:hypothetical protein